MLCTEQVVSEDPPTAEGMGMSCEFEGFIGRCLQVNETKRLSAAELLKHSFITKNTVGSSLLDLAVKAPHDVSGARSLQKAPTPPLFQQACEHAHTCACMVSRIMLTHLCAVGRQPKAVRCLAGAL